MHRRYHPLKWIIFTLSVSFYFYEYYLRVAPSVMINDLMHAFSIGAGTVGLISAFYFYAYAPMQIPVGILTDRYGARRLLSIGALLAGMGTIVMAMSPTVLLLSLGRFVLGFGSSFAFVGMIYVCTHWFPKKRRALLIGIANSIGMLGAVIGEGPMSLLIYEFGWRWTLMILGLIGLALALLLFIIVRKENADDIQDDGNHERAGLIESLKLVLGNPRSWMIAFISFAFYSMTTSFAGLWGVAFLETVYQVHENIAAFLCSLIFIGWVVGGPIFGYISDHYQRRKIPLIILLGVATVITVIVIYTPPVLPIGGAGILLFCLGIVSSGQLLTYSLCIESNPIRVKATSTSFVNSIVFIGGSMLQPMIGVLLDARWDGTMNNTLPMYSVGSYRFALSSFVILMVLAWMISFFIRSKPRVIT